MPSANEDFMHRYIDCWVRGDPKAAEEFWAEDVVLHMFGRNPLSGEYRGKEQYRSYVQKMYEATAGAGGEAKLLKVYDILASDNYGVALLRSRFERPGKEPLEINRSVVFLLRDGKIQHEWVYDDDQYAVDEFYS